jgi:hypothetical protein
MKRIGIIVAALWFGSTAWCTAQTAVTPDQLGDLQKQVDTLKHEIDALKSGSSQLKSSGGDQGGLLDLSYKGSRMHIYGFFETENDLDTTQSLTEAQSNVQIQKRVLEKVQPDGETQNIGENYAGQTGRDILSVRNSRLGIEATLPTLDSGLKSSGKMEFDFLGNDSPTTAPGAVPGAQSEANYFNFAALRIRLMYMTLEYGELKARLGQDWSPFGWQPYYTQPETLVQPTVGKVENRTAQAMVTDTHHFGEDLQVETHAGVARPPAMNDSQFEYHAGIRASDPHYVAYEPSVGGGAMLGLSAAFSEAFIPVRTFIGSQLGDAEAADIFIPILASKDGKDRANNLGIGAEYANGAGVGVTEYPNLTMGVGGVAAAQGGAFIDTGIAGVNQGTNMELIRLQTWRAWLTYSPIDKVHLGGGYAEVAGRNLDRFTPTATAGAGGVATWTAAANAITPRLQYAYVSAIYDPANWLRFSAELAQTRDTYNDPVNRYAVNNRLQLAAFLFF